MANNARLANANSALQQKERLALARSGWTPDELRHDDDKRFRVDPEFEALIPPLLPDDRDALEASLLAEGCRDALVIWCTGDELPVLIDGHNRYRLCRQHGISFETVERTFDSREDVMLWMIRNQRARRNLNKYMRGLVAIKEKDILSIVYKRNQGKRTDLQSTTTTDDFSSNLKKSSDAWKDAAQVNDMSVGTMSDVSYVEENGLDFIKEKARAGEITPHRAKELTKALEGVGSDVVEAVERYGVEDPSTVILMTHLHDEGRESWNEIRDSGHIQITDETDAVAITAPSVLLYKAVEKKSGEHRHIGGQESAAKAEQRTGVPAALQSSESNEWYTPRPYLEAVHAVLGHVDVDPASNAEANAIVRAVVFYDIHSDGLSHAWGGKVFLNPPYGRDGISNQERWSHRLIEQYEAGITTEAILLVNAVTDRAWFQPLWNYPICFTDHRVPFYRPGGVAGAQPVCGSALVYFGHNPEKFTEVFRKFGAVVLRVVRGDTDGSSAK